MSHYFTELLTGLTRDMYCVFVDKKIQQISFYLIARYNFQPGGNAVSLFFHDSTTIYERHAGVEYSRRQRDRDAMVNKYRLRQVLARALLCHVARFRDVT